MKKYYRMKIEDYGKLILKAKENFENLNGKKPAEIIKFLYESTGIDLRYDQMLNIAKITGIQFYKHTNSQNSGNRVRSIEIIAKELILLMQSLGHPINPKLTDIVNHNKLNT